MKSQKEKMPFVIAAEVIDFDSTVWAVPVGVELADCTIHAYQQAIQRWPYHNLFKPEPWEKISPEIRLAALEAERMTIPN